MYLNVVCILGVMCVCNGLRRACLSILYYVSLFSKSKQSISSPPRSIPHVRDIDKINPAQLDSGQKLINDSIRTMSGNLMAKFSSMFDQYQSRQHNISCTSSFAVPGQSAARTEPASCLPTDRITCPAGRRFRKGHEDTVLHEDISVCNRIMDETPATPRHPPGDTGEPQVLRRAPAFVRHHQTGTGFHSQPNISYRKDNDDDVRDSEANVTQSDRNYVRLMHSIHNRFTYSVPASLLGSIHDGSCGIFSQHRRLHHLRSPL